MDLKLLEAELRRDEGVRPLPYKDTEGVNTVGVGHNLDAAPLPAGWKYPLSDAQMTQLLAQDVSSTLAKLDRAVPWWRGMDEVRQRVVANVCFNLGIGSAASGKGLLGFKKAVAAMQRGDFATAAAEMKDSKWYRQVGQRSVRLCSAMLTGVMPSA
ncbi:glycoside hydrolase family protein [Caballeronia zhejiangensis]|uniref:glycoside hydrolase family protein n=1 Tax=Caballeronia zhejiangensis TaxID=871203 RepID=UPI00158884E5|nr:lysozyme [Caballeronia zhejiangensis]